MWVKSDYSMGPFICFPTPRESYRKTWSFFTQKRTQRSKQKGEGSSSTGCQREKETENRLVYEAEV